MTAQKLLLIWLAGTIMTSEESVMENTLVVDSSNMSLHYIPSNFTKSITKLILSNNLILMSKSDLKALENYPKLMELHLDGNSLMTLPDNLQASLTELKVLNVSNNNISTVDPEAFSGMTYLQELDLSHNLLQSLPMELFTGLRNLTTLRLNRNRLGTLTNLADMKQLKSIDLDGNPWNCSCKLAKEMKRVMDSKVIVSSQAFCASPKDQANENILNATCFSQSSMAPLQNTTPSPAQTTSPGTSDQNKNTKTFDQDQDQGSRLPTTGNTWKFLVGVMVIVLGTSMLIVCAVKSPSWYKLLFNYRHQRLHEEEEPNVFPTGGRYSNFSLDTEQTETSAHELDAGLEEVEEEEDDGYIEDRYIETGDYKDNSIEEL